jgi:hypothetical protein
MCRPGRRLAAGSRRVISTSSHAAVRVVGRVRSQDVVVDHRVRVADGGAAASPRPSPRSSGLKPVRRARSSSRPTVWNSELAKARSVRPRNPATPLLTRPLTIGTSRQRRRSYSPRPRATPPERPGVRPRRLPPRRPPRPPPPCHQAGGGAPRRRPFKPVIQCTLFAPQMSERGKALSLARASQSVVEGGVPEFAAGHRTEWAGRRTGPLRERKVVLGASDYASHAYPARTSPALLRVERPSDQGHLPAPHRWAMSPKLPGPRAVPGDSKSDPPRT